MYGMIEADLQDKLKTTADEIGVTTLEYKPTEMGKIKTLEDASIEELMAEVKNRKNTIIPELIKQINDNIATLKTLGIEIEDSENEEYILSELKKGTYNNGDIWVEFQTVYKR